MLNFHELVCLQRFYWLLIKWKPHTYHVHLCNLRHWTRLTHLAHLTHLTHLTRLTRSTNLTRLTHLTQCRLRFQRFKRRQRSRRRRRDVRLHLRPKISVPRFAVGHHGGAAEYNPAPHGHQWTGQLSYLTVITPGAKRYDAFSAYLSLSKITSYRYEC